MTSGRPAADGAHGHRLAFWVVAVLASTLHWIPHFPPQIDLAQHAGQIRFLHDWNSPAFAYRDLLALNFFTPYLPAYLLGALLSLVMPVVVAVKVLWTLGAAGTIYAAVRLRRALGGSEALDWLILPGLFGTTFEWGLLTFQFAVPFGLLSVEYWVRHLRSPQSRSGVLMAVALILLFFAHVLLTAWVMSVCALMLLADCRSRRASVSTCARRMLPLVSPLPIVVIWVAATRTIEQTNGAPVFRWSTRYLDFLPQWLGVSDRTFLVCVVGAVAATMALQGVRFLRDPISLAPLVATMLILLVAPDYLYGNAFTYNRFFTLLGPALACALTIERSRRPVNRYAGLVLPATACVWVLGLTIRMIQFAGEQQDFVRLVRDMEPNRRTLGMVMDPVSRVFNYPYAHFPAWYQAEHGGMVEPSFASYLPMIVRFRERDFESVRFRFVLAPDLAAVRHLENFDYVIIRGRDMARPSTGSFALTLTANEGRWWLFSRTAPAP
ncbi:MAG TPA: hypothetical protein VE861_03965 [Gemmatimonadaceae bacterium]|nr:hypothetical protein [Gemmatimonadaceae bacterium]